MIASNPLRRSGIWLAVAVAIATALLAWHTTWWTIAVFVLAVAAMVFDWQSMRGRYGGSLDEVERLRRRVHEIVNLQGRFVGNVAHEIKTPLTVVLAEIDVLRMRCDDEHEVRKIAGVMAAEIRHLSDLVDSFLLLANPLVGEDTSNHESVFIGDVVIAAAGRCRELGRALRVRIVTVLGEPDNGDPTAEVMGDPVLLEVMVENLVRNALRLSPPDAQVEIETRSAPDSVQVVVRDHGMGIPPEHHDSVFEWFLWSPEGASKAHGTGFGLAIAKRVADHHGGSIELRDAPAGGCEFMITLPRYWQPGPCPDDAGAGCRHEPPVAPKA